VQNIVSASEEHHEEASVAKHISNNNYMNANPSNIIPIPSGMCIPDCTGDATVVADLGQESAKERHGDFNETRDSEVCSEITKTKSSLSQSSVDEIDSASQGQESVATKYDQEHDLPADSASVLQNTNKATEIKMPEYMNLAVNMGHDAINNLGAIPKKLPAPPVPPRGMIFRHFAQMRDFAQML